MWLFSHDSTKGSTMALHTGIAMTVNAIQAVVKSPLKKQFFNRYSQGTFTIKQLSEEFGISPSSVKRKLKDYTPKKIEHSPRKVVVQMDTTYWGRNFGLVLFYGC